ncbi:lipopolysaccharide biosynthesis protein [Geodermatophilus sp. SYSU D00079]
MASQLSAVTRQVGPVAIGLGVLGLASFAFLSVSGRALGPAELAPLGTLWVLINALGPALFQPLEQEVGRAVASRAAHGQGARPVFLRACALAGGLIVLAGAVLLLAREPLADEVFAGQDVLVAALFLGLVGLGAEHLTRGAFAGGGAFPRYGAQLGIDGVLRIGSAAVLAVVGVSTAGWYGVFLGLAPIAAVLLTAGWLGPANQPGPHHSWGELSHAVGWLTLGALASQFVINAAPVAANLLAGPQEQARAGIFISVLVLARVPLFLFAAIQASFLPGMAALAAEGDTAGFRRRLNLIAGAVTALGAAGLLVILAVGPWLVRLVYGAEYVTTRADLWPLAAASGLFMLASVLAQTLVSVRGYRASVLGWLAGTAAFLLGLLVPFRLEQRVGFAFLAGSAVAVLVLAIAMRRRLRSPLNAGMPASTRGEDIPWT